MSGWKGVEGGQRERKTRSGKRAATATDFFLKKPLLGWAAWYGAHSGRRAKGDPLTLQQVLPFPKEMVCGGGVPVFEALVSNHFAGAMGTKVWAACFPCQKSRKGNFEDTKGTSLPFHVNNPLLRHSLRLTPRDVFPHFYLFPQIFFFLVFLFSALQILFFSISLGGKVQNAVLYVFILRAHFNIIILNIIKRIINLNIIIFKIIFKYNYIFLYI